MISTRSQLSSRNLKLDLDTWSTPNPTTLILFICGNPALIDWYTPFLSHLHTNKTQVYAMGHLGHSLEDSGKYYVELREQAVHKVKFIEQLKAEFDIGLGKDQVKLILIGHSIGGWFCMEVSYSSMSVITAYFC